MEKVIVIKNVLTGKFIALDSASGGYPYETDIRQCKIWISKQEAHGYMNVMGYPLGWDIITGEIHFLADQDKPPKTDTKFHKQD